MDGPARPFVYGALMPGDGLADLPDGWPTYRG